MAPPVFGLMVVGSLKPISVMVLLWIVPAVPAKAPDVPICMPFWVWNAVWVPMIVVVVDVDGQPRAVGEDAGLLEVADGRILDLDMVGVGRAVAGDDDRMVALVAGGFAAAAARAHW